MSVYSYKEIEIEPVTATTATPSVQLGTYRQENNAEYIYMYNDGAAVNAGCPVILTGTSGYSFVKTYATAADTSCVFAGVVAATCAAASYGWVATRGFANLYVISSVVAVGDKMRIADGGGSGRAVTMTSLLTRVFSVGVIGRAMNLATAAATAGCMVYMR